MVKNVIEKIITKYNNINWVNIIKYKTLFIDKFNNVRYIIIFNAEGFD
jgi:uncharacterized protein with HEPN domain